MNLEQDAAEALARLDESLALHGTGQIVITRAAVTATVNARCRAAKADELVSRSNSAQIVYKGIVSGTGLETLGPLRRNDKVLFQGIERTVLWADPIRYGEILVRVNFEFAG